MTPKKWRVPLVIRGEVIDTDELESGGRRGDVGVVTPDVSRYLDRLVLDRPSRMADLYQLKFDDIVDYLAQLGECLKIADNP